MNPAQIVSLLVLVAISSVTASPAPHKVVARRATSTTFAVVPPSSTSTDPHDQFNSDVVKDVICTGSTLDTIISRCSAIANTEKCYSQSESANR